MGKSRALIGTIGIALILAISMVIGPAASAAGQPTVNLGSAANFAVLAGSGITNTGPTVIAGDVGSFANPSITGFPPGLVNGTNHGGDGLTQSGKVALTDAYNDAAGRTPANTVPTELGGSVFTSGVYKSAAGTFGITGNVVLDGLGDANSVFIFEMASTLITATGSSVTLVRGAQPCNVFWRVGSSATLAGGSAFSGNILALTSITLVTGATVNGRLLAQNGAVTLDTNTITRSLCATPAAPAPQPDVTLTPTVSPSPTASPSPSASPAPVIAPVATATPTPMAAPTTPVAVLPVQTLPSTSTVDGNGPIALAGLLLVLMGALIIGSRRPKPTIR